MVKLGGSLPTITVAYKETGKRMNINERDYNPEKHVLWDEYAAGLDEEPPPPPVGDAQVEIIEADNLGALVRIAGEHRLKLPGNIKNVKTAQAKLLAQLEG